MSPFAWALSFVLKCPVSSCGNSYCTLWLKTNKQLSWVSIHHLLLPGWCEGLPQGRYEAKAQHARGRVYVCARTAVALELPRGKGALPEHYLM